MAVVVQCAALDMTLQIRKLFFAGLGLGRCFGPSGAG
jgi:hypothetical protein